MNNQMYGGVEAGGTKFICCVGNSSGDIMAKTEIATTTPDATLRQVVEFFKQNQPVVSLGIGSFGPLDLNPQSAKFGYIADTPKTGWQNTNLKGFFEKELAVPVAIDTDVNCAALGEKHFGLARDAGNFIYLTVGTGIGGSLVIDNKVYRGASHLEMGHMRVAREGFDASFDGVCPFHGDCLEGLASGNAMQKRWGKQPQTINDVKAWQLEAEYLGSAIANLAMIARPELFILGGGVINREDLIRLIRRTAKAKINNYIATSSPEKYIVKSTNSNNAILGALKLAAASK